ncbi:MAG: lysylphosphatidylglycerol synthase domain-containing protein [Alphaproteobacteria bacterium]
MALNRSALIAGVLGVAVIVALAVNFDPEKIRASIADIGWGGVAALALFRLLPVLLCALGWWLLVPPSHALPFSACLGARLGRDGVSGVIAVLPAGGEIVGARMLALRGLTPSMAAATMVADLTVEMASQAVFTLLGIAALFLSIPGAAGWWAWVALVLSVLMVLGLWLLQHPRLLAVVETLAARLVSGPVWEAWLCGGSGLRSALDGVYGQRWRLAGGFGVHLLAWLVGVAESWLALRMMGQPMDYVPVLALEAVVFAVRNVSFAVPWAAGVQEGGYLALGVALGMGPEVALTLSLVRRFPDFVLGLPGLLLWQLQERRSLVAESP